MYYSSDLRKKVIEYAREHTIEETAKVFNIGTTTVSRWKKLIRETGTLEVEKTSHRAQRKICLEKLKEYVKEKPDAYLY